MKKFVIHLIGPSCSGKSTVEEILKEKLPGIYVIASDTQKRQLAGYHRDKDRELIKKIIKGLHKAVCEIGNSILLIATINTEDEYKSYKETAIEYGYEFISIQLTASNNTLLSRFKERLESAKIQNIMHILSVKDEETFMENLSRPLFVPEDIVSFNTSEVKSEYIVDKILELVK
jgi:predicted kinase